MTAQILTAEDFALLSQYSTNGDRTAYYGLLAAKGYDYGRLALGVVQNDILSGQVGNAYAALVAQENGVALTAAQTGKR